MRKLYIIAASIILPILLSACGRESAPAELSGFSEGEYHGSFETVFENPNNSVQTIIQRGEISFLFNNSVFYYEGEVKYSADNIYPLEINSQGEYEFSRDTIYFIEPYIPIDSTRGGSLNLLPFFTCEYAGNVMYLTKHSKNEILTITLRKR